jgi:hypothetical protein
MEKFNPRSSLVSKLLLAIFVSVFALNSSACSGKKEEEKKKFSSPATQVN